MKNSKYRIIDFCFVTDFVANGSFASLKKNVKYLEDDGYAILVRFTDHVKKWKSKFKYVSKEAYKFLKHSSLQTGDLIMSNVGEPGQVCLLPNLEKPMTLGPNSILIRPDSKIATSKYLFYYFQSQKGKDQIKKIITSTAQAKFNKTSFRALEINLPTLSQQEEIIYKLDLANRLSQKHEDVFLKIDQLSKSIFFNTFNLNKESKVKIKDLFDINNNKIKVNLDDDTKVRFIPMSNISAFTKTIVEKQFKKYAEVKKGYTPIKNNDLIVAKITPCYENGKMAIAENLENDVAYGSTEFHTFRSKDKRLIIFLYTFLMDDQIKNLGKSNMKGSSGHKRVPADFFSNLLIPNPSSSQLDTFCEYIRNINKLKQRYNNSRKINYDLKLSLLNQSFIVS